MFVADCAVVAKNAAEVTAVFDWRVIQLAAVSMFDDESDT